MMSGLELAASIVAFVDFSAKVVSRIHEFSSRSNETPETFRTLVVQLPLLNIILQRIRLQAVAGHVDSKIITALKPVVDETAEQTKYLNEKLTKIIPPRNASSLDRGLGALRSILSESAVTNALDKIHSCVNILVLHDAQAASEISATILREVQRLSASAASEPNKEETTNLLHEAARQGHLSSIRSIIRPPIGADVDAPDECGRTPLHTAASNGQRLAVSRLCYLRAFIDAEDDFGQTPLHAAVIADHIDTAYVLIERGASLIIKDDQGKRALEYAKSGFLTRWRILHGMDVNAKDPATGNTALIQATIQADLEAVTCLLVQGARVDLTNNTLSTALAEACVNGNVEIACLLLEHGADPNTTDVSHWSPFQLCILYNHTELVQVLLDDRRVNLEAANSKDHRTPLLEAIYNHQWDIVQLLLQRGANPNARTEDGRNVLRCAVLWCNDDKTLRNIINLFVQKKGDVNMTDVDGWTAMMESVNHRRFGGAELLLQHGASANGFVEHEPLASVCVKRNYDLQWLRMLAQHGVNLEATNWDGWTALREAVFWGHNDMTRELLALGANPNSRARSNCHNAGHDNVTILMTAVWSGQRHVGFRFRDAINQLLEHGARLEDQDSHGWTALRVAIEKGYEDIACFLLVKGAKTQTMGRDGQTALARAKDKNLHEFCKLVDVRETII